MNKFLYLNALSIIMIFPICRLCMDGYDPDPEYTKNQPGKWIELCVEYSIEGEKAYAQVPIEWDDEEMNKYILSRTLYSSPIFVEAPPREWCIKQLKICGNIIQTEMKTAEKLTEIVNKANL
jgi:hypothetical protein